MRRSTTALLLAGLLAASPAFAQWKWTDADGRVNYSDRPPPPAVPADRISRIGPADASRSASPQAPGALPASAQGAQGASAMVQGAPAGATARPDAARSWADRALEARRKQADQEAAARKAQDQAAAAENLNKVCEGARTEMRTLESGMRVSRVRPDGEREFMEDDERAARMQFLDREIRAQCPSS